MLIDEWHLQLEGPTEASSLDIRKLVKRVTGMIEEAGQGIQADLQESVGMALTISVNQ